MSKTLEQFQEEGKAGLIHRRKVILGDDMGLGKTVQAMAAWMSIFGKLNPYNSGTRTLIVCPSTVRFRWEEEINDWQAGAYQIVNGTMAKRVKQINTPYEFTIIHYDVVNAHKDLLAKIPWDCIILDEAHRVKNRRAKVSKALDHICRKSPEAYKWLLTGTPYQNGAEEIWHLLHLIDPKEFSSFWQWANKFLISQTIKLNNGPSFVKFGGIANKEEFRKMVDPHLIRRVRKDINRPTQYIKIPIELGPKQKQHYVTMAKQWYMELLDGDEINASNALSRLMRLRQICFTPKILDPEYDTEEPGAKFDVITDLLDGTDDKVVVFSWFKGGTKLLMEYLYSKKYGVVGFTGDDDLVARQKAVEQFRTNPKIKVIALTLGAGGTGLDGLQTVSSTVIMVDKHWNPSINAQAIARVADRMGAKGAATVYSLVSKDTIEERVESILARKDLQFTEGIVAKEVMKAMLELGEAL